MFSDCPTTLASALAEASVWERHPARVRVREVAQHQDLIPAPAQDPALVQAQVAVRLSDSSLLGRRHACNSSLQCLEVRERRKDVSTNAPVGSGYWELTLLHAQMKGKALFFKTIGVRQEYTRSNFKQVPDDLAISKAVEMMQKQGSTKIDAHPGSQHN